MSGVRVRCDALCLLEQGTLLDEGCAEKTRAKDEEPKTKGERLFDKRMVQFRGCSK